MHIGVRALRVKTVLFLVVLCSASLSWTQQVRVPDAQMIEMARQYSASSGGRTFLVMDDGSVLREDYPNGGRADRPQLLASGSKSFVGITALAAVQDGLIRLDDYACESLSEWKNNPLKSRITYRQLLTLTSGLTPEKLTLPRNTPSWKAIVASPMTGKPGEQFEYGAYQLIAFGEALQRKLHGESFEAYLQRRILEPLGVRVLWLTRCVDGNPQLGGGGYMTARDWAKFGEFVRLQGNWQGKQIIRAELFAELIHGTAHNPAYGLTWWLKQPMSNAVRLRIPLLRGELGDFVTAPWLPADLFMAAGAGNQRLYIIPSLHLVVVRQAALSDNTHYSDLEFLSRLLRGTPYAPAVK